MLIEIDGDVLRFQTISRRGKRVDSGEIRRGADLMIDMFALMQPQPSSIFRE